MFATPSIVNAPTLGYMYTCVAKSDDDYGQGAFEMGPVAIAAAHRSSHRPKEGEASWRNMAATLRAHRHLNGGRHPSSPLRLSGAFADASADGCK